MSAAIPVLAPGQSPPLTVISPTNQSGVLLIVTALGLVFALVSILIRLYIRLQIRHAYERDDTAVAVAMVFSIIQSSVVFVEVSKGYGKTIGDISASGIIDLQKLVRWQVVFAFDIITELALIGNSVYLVQDLQVPLGKKVVVVLAFALRLPIIAPAALRLYYLNIEYSSSDPTLSGVLASVCAQIETSYAIISATIPCLRPFMSSLNTHYGAPAKPKSTSGTGSGGSNPLTPLESLSKEGRSLGTKKREARGEMWDKPRNLTSVTRGEKHSIDSHDSKQMIITKDTEFRVEFEGESGTQTPRTADKIAADA
ncbi:hypothetical protein V494_04294 [Pseudogymnoascus sp. VKM F-4513 (FW-928)]|nr:hypothetical protein V494_04294 [Pseudogymnoascus sp. VKM F-4513 (FW-928)]